MATPRADRLRNDEAILRTASRVLAREPAASIQTIADAAGVARLTVYRRYPDREALVAAMRTAVDAELDAALDGLPDWSSGTETAAALVRALTSVAARYPVALLRYAAPADGPPAADARIVRLLRGGQSAGVLRADIAARSLNAVLFGVLSAVLADADHSDSDPGVHDADAAAELVLALLLPGLIPPTKGPA